MEKGRYAVFGYTKKIMADGNYNRNILPYHNYQSGYRAGRAAMRRLALEAFDKWLQENEGAFTADKADEARAAFQLLIRD